MPAQPSPSFDVVVAGGGAVGLATALGLSMAGARVALTGAVRQPRNDGRTAALMQPSVRFLDEIGALPRLEPLSNPLAAMRLIDLTGGLIRAPTVTFRASEIDLPWFALNFANADLVREMTAELEARGAAVYAGLVTSIEPADDRTRLILDDGTTLDGRLVVAADGQKSTVREAAGIEVRRWSYPQTALTFHIRHSRDHEDVSTEFHRRPGPLTLVPFGDHRAAVVWLEAPQEAERLRALAPAELAEEVQRESSSLLGDVEIVTPVAAVPMHGLMAARAVAPRLALAGETLHAFPPIGAQGLNLGLRDARALVDTVSKALARGEDPGVAAVLDRYAAARKPDATARTWGVDLLNRSLFADLLPLDVLRAAGLGAAATLPPVRRFLMRVGMG